MKAWLINKYGSIQDLTETDIEKPSPKPDELLVEVKAVGLNPADLWVITGGGTAGFLHAKNFPFPTGFDYAGVAASDSGHIKSGERVFGHLPYSRGNRKGSLAEYVTVKISDVAKIPAGVSFGQAAAMPTAGLAAYQGLTLKAQTGSDSQVYVNGATGGVGSYAVRIAKNLGATVTAACSKRNESYAASLGADSIVDYKDVDWSSFKNKFDVIIDAACLLSYNKVSGALRAKGSYVTFLPSPSFIVGKIRSLFSSKACRFVEVASKPEDLKVMGDWLASGKLNVNLEHSFGFAEAHKALTTLESGVTGKVTIVY